MEVRFENNGQRQANTKQGLGSAAGAERAQKFQQQKRANLENEQPLTKQQNPPASLHRSVASSERLSLFEGRTEVVVVAAAVVAAVGAL